MVDVRAAQRNPTTSFTMSELARAVWGGHDGTKMQTKVKVAVSRLRALIGKEHDVIHTTRIQTEEHGSVVGYTLSPKLHYLLVEHQDME